MCYKWCAVPKCTHTSIKTPGKLFVCVPKNAKIRRTWLQLARRNPNEIMGTTNIFFCEDHFEIEKDMVNYYQYKMGFSQRINMVNGVLPSKFNCQQDRNKGMGSTNSCRSAYVKRQRMKLIEECENTLQVAKNDQPTATMDGVCNEKAENMPMELFQTCSKSTSTEAIVTADKSIQFNCVKKAYFRSKQVQTRTLTTDTIVSPYKIPTTSCSTSPINIIFRQPHVKGPESKFFSIRKRIGFINEEKSDSDVSFYGGAPSKQYFNCANCANCANA